MLAALVLIATTWTAGGWSGSRPVPAPKPAAVAVVAPDDLYEPIDEPAAPTVKPAVLPAPAPNLAPVPAEWRTWDVNPEYEVLGRDVNGTFIWTHYRRKADPTPLVTYRAAPQPYTVVAAPSACYRAANGRMVCPRR